MTDSRRCRELEPTLAPYVDGESAADERASVEAHLERCPPCRDRVAGERAVRDVLHARRDELRPSASDPLRARCAAHAGQMPARPAPVSRVRRLVPLSLAATLLLAIGGIFAFGVNHEAIAAQLALDHLKCFDVIGEDGPVDAASAAAAWAAERDWTIAVAPSSPELGLQLVGVRRCFSTDGAAAHCMYRWRDQDLSVYIVPHPLQTLGTAEQAVEKFGHRAIMWRSADRTYFIVTRGRRDGLDAVAAHIRRSVR